MTGERGRLTLRQGTEADMPFLHELHHAAMRPHVERIWGTWVDEDARKEFRAKTDPATHDIVLLEDTPVGCRWVRRHPDALELVRLYLMPAHQNAGLGTRLMADLLETSATTGLPIRLRVLKGNPARRFYERLGFRVTRETEAHDEMARAPHSV